jgi:phosphate transport system substrate-binding protein
MRDRRTVHRVSRLAAAVVLASTASMIGGIIPAHGATQVVGAGSTWSSIAMDQWVSQIAHQGIDINYQPNGSTAGRTEYYQDQVDFAVSEIPFQQSYIAQGSNQNVNEIAEAQHRPYVYLPIVAGGTSFMYHIDVNGQHITDLKLSEPTLAAIFTGAITNWNDPAVTTDNGGRQLPSIPITPVVRSDGSGTSAQFTAWLANQSPNVWDAFCAAQGLPASPHCAPTSQYPIFNGAVAQQLSDGVAAYVSSSYNNGAITYVEYAYALQRNYPVASVLNAAGYYTQPTPQNVAVALQAAQINSDRTQNLNGVYSNPDPRTYPVSSYSYMIAPASTASPFNTDKGAVLGNFILYFVCAGQQKVADLGYSPLPQNLVQFAFDAEQQIPGAPTPPDISQCANPTITGGFTTQNAPLPPPSAKQGATAPAPDGSASGGDSSGSGSSGGGSSPTSSAGGASSGGGSAAGASSAAGATGTTGASSAGTVQSAAGNTTGSAAGSNASAADQGTVASGGAVDPNLAPVDSSTVSSSSVGQVASAARRQGGTALNVATARSVTIAGNHLAVVPFLLIALLVLLIVFLPPSLVVARSQRSGVPLAAAPLADAARAAPAWSAPPPSPAQSWNPPPTAWPPPAWTPPGAPPDPPAWAPRSGPPPSRPS